MAGDDEGILNAAQEEVVDADKVTKQTGERDAGESHRALPGLDDGEGVLEGIGGDAAVTGEGVVEGVGDEKHETDEVGEEEGEDELEGEVVDLEEAGDGDEDDAAENEKGPAQASDTRVGVEEAGHPRLAKGVEPLDRGGVPDALLLIGWGVVVV